MDKMGALSKAVVLTVSRGLSFVPLAVIVHRLGRPPVGFVMIFVWFTGLTLDKIPAERRGIGSCAPRSGFRSGHHLLHPNPEETKRPGPFMAASAMNNPGHYTFEWHIRFTVLPESRDCTPSAVTRPGSVRADRNPGYLPDQKAH